jgi:hypothetical protein
VDVRSGADEIAAGLVFILLGVGIYLLREVFARWAVRFYGRMAEALPWLYPGPLRGLTRERYLRWLVLATSVIWLAIGLGFIAVGFVLR